MARPQDPAATQEARTGRSSRGIARASTIGVAACVAVGVVARFVTDSPLWLDEALSVNIARLPAGDIAGALRHDGHPPLYYFLLHAWTGAFGDGDLAARSLSGVFGVAALPVVWRAARRAAGPEAGLAALAVLALFPFAVRYSSEARMYSMVMLLVAVGMLLLRRAVDERHLPWWRAGGLAVVTAALVLTQYWAFFLGAATVVTLAWWAWRGDAAARRVAVRGVGALAAGSLAFLPWAPSFLDQLAHTGTPWAGAPRPPTVVQTTLLGFGGGEREAEPFLFAVVLVAAVLLGVFGRAGAATTELSTTPVPGIRGEVAVVALTLGIGTTVGLVTDSAFAPRYAAVIVPLVVIVAARGVVTLPAGLPRLLGLGIVCLLGAAASLGVVIEDRTQAGVLAAAVEARAAPGDVVVVCPDQLGPATGRALRQSGVAVDVLAYPTLDDGRFVDWYDYEARNDSVDPAAVAATLLERTPEDAAVFVAWSPLYRTFEGDCEALLAALGRARGVPESLVTEDATSFFEHAGLFRFAPVS